jgi:general secretion pathway protein G
MDEKITERKMRRGFSLVEILIVVAILGILAAIVVPQFQSHSQQAKEAAAKDNLRILRQQFEFYAAQHNGLAPGYIGANLLSGLSLVVLNQMLYYTNVIGQPAATKSDNFPYGPYLSKMPENSFNKRATVRVLADAESFPESASGTYGWIYKPAIKEIRLDWPGTDNEGVRYYDY